MAFKKLAQYTTLDLMMANVRSQTGAMSEQESVVFEAQITDVCHNAILLIRSIFNKFLDTLYNTIETVTETNEVINIQDKDIFNIHEMHLYDATHGPVPIMQRTLFNSLRHIYGSTNRLATALFGTIGNKTVGTDEVLVIEIYRGSSKVTPGTLTLTYPRNPKKVEIGDADRYLDLPEHLVPIATDIATLAIHGKLQRTPPVEVSERIQAVLGPIAAQVGLRIDQAKN